MMTHDAVEKIDDKLAIIRKDGKSLTFQVVHPENARIQTYSTDPKNNFEDKNPGKVMVGFEVALSPNQKTDFIVLLIPEGGQRPESINLDALTDW